MLRHQQRALFLFVASVLILACAGCEKRLQGRYVCTQELKQEYLTGQTLTVRPVLDFRQDGTVYLDGVFSGQDHFQASYSVASSQVRFTMLGGLQVNTGTMHGDVIETDFEQPQMVKVTKKAEGAGMYQGDLNGPADRVKFIAPGQTYETTELQSVKLSFKYAGDGGITHGPLLPVAIIVLILFVVLLVVILLPKLNLHLGGRDTRTYLPAQQAPQPPQPPPGPVQHAPPGALSQEGTIYSDERSQAMMLIPLGGLLGFGLGLFLLLKLIAATGNRIPDNPILALCVAVPTLGGGLVVGGYLAQRLLQKHDRAMRRKRQAERDEG